MSAKTIRVGVAWIKKTQAGTEIISMIITNPVGQDFRYTLWPSVQKATEASPDYNVTKQADPPPAWAGRSASRPETDESGHQEQSGDPGPGAGDDGQIPF